MRWKAEFVRVVARLVRARRRWDAVLVTALVVTATCAPVLGMVAVMRR
jgi:hypothetical protein